LPERDGRIDRTDLPDTLSGIFLKARLDDPNHFEMAGQIAVCAQRVFGPIVSESWPAWHASRCSTGRSLSVMSDCHEAYEADLDLIHRNR
jgi:hypothetical protein